MRTREIREIRTLLLDGDSVRVVAPPGAGRSYLLRSLARELETRGYTPFLVIGRRPFREQPYGALREAGLVSLRGAQSESNIVEELMQGLEPLGHPAILIDDAEHLDLNSAYLLEQVRQRREVPLVVVTPPFVMLDEKGRSATGKIRTQARLELAPLGYAQISLLARRLLGAPAQPEVVSQVLSLSSGITGIAAEILRSAKREQRILQHESGWALHAPTLWNVHLRTTVEQLIGGLNRDEFRVLHALALAESTATERLQAVAGPELRALAHQGLLTTFADAHTGTHVAPRPSLIIDYFQEHPVDPLHYEAMDLLRELDDATALERALERTAEQLNRAQTFDRFENRGTGGDRHHRSDTSHRLALAAREWQQAPTVAHAVAYLDVLLAADGYHQHAAEVLARVAEADAEADPLATHLLLHRLFWATQSDPATSVARLRRTVLSVRDPALQITAEAFEASLLFSRFGWTAAVEHWMTAAAERNDSFSVTARHFIGVLAGRETTPIEASAVAAEWSVQRHITDIANTLLRARQETAEAYERGLRTAFADARTASDYRGITVGAYFLAHQEAATFHEPFALEPVSVTLALGTPNLMYADFYCAQLRWAAYLHYLNGEPDLARSVLAEAERYPGTYGPLPAMHPIFGEILQHLIAGETDYAVGLLIEASVECHATLHGDAAWAYAAIAFTERPTAAHFAQMETVAQASAHATPALLRLVRGALEGDPALSLLAQRLTQDSEIAIAVSFLTALHRETLGDTSDAPGPGTSVLRETIRELRALLLAGGPRQVPPLASLAQTLTKREYEIALLAATLQNREIAERLSISVRTVENHLARAMKKLGVSTRTQLTAADGLPG